MNRRSGGLRATGVAVDDKNRIVAVGREEAQRPVGDGRGRHDDPALQPKIAGSKGFLVTAKPQNHREIHAAVLQARAGIETD